MSYGFVVIMGSQKDVMILFAERDINQIFPEREGWKITQLNTALSTGGVYRLSRYNRGGYETVFIKVSFEQTPNENSVNALDELSDGKSSRIAKYILTPQGTDNSGMPVHIRTLPMSAFAFAEGNLVWLTKKKNAKKFPAEAIPA